MVYYSNTIREKKRHLGLRVLTFFFFFLVDVVAGFITE